LTGKPVFSVFKIMGSNNLEIKDLIKEIKEFINYVKTNFTEEQINNFSSDSNYRAFKISKKKSNQKRIITVPTENIKNFQRSLLPILNNIYKILMPNNVYGYIEKYPLIGIKHRYNIKLNAENHIAKEWILNFDLNDFFNSIKVEKINDLFLSNPFNLSKNDADILTKITTYKETLPIGAITSPILSNFMLIKADLELNKIASKFQLTYTRYADDFTFSADKKPSNLLINEIFLIITNNGYGINFKKFNLKNKNHRQEVTGLIVNRKLNIKNEYYKLIRAILNNFKNDYGKARKKYLETFNHQYNRSTRKRYSRFFNDNFENIKEFEINIKPDLFYSNENSDYFIKHSIKSKIEYIQFIIGRNNPKVESLWNVYNFVFHNKVIDNVIVPSNVVFVTNATAKSVVFYAYLYLKSNKINEPEIIKILSECSINNNLIESKLKDKFISQAAEFIVLYDYLKSNNRFENFIKSNIESGEINKIVKDWENRKKNFLPKFYRQIFHDNIDCTFIRSDYNESDGVHKNTGILAHDGYKQSEVIYTVNKDFLKKIGMRCCLMCTKEGIVKLVDLGIL